LFAGSLCLINITSRLLCASLRIYCDYNECRDAYFTCMDQFCANLDDTYRRCVCSERLDKIRADERKLKQTGEQLKDFAEYNIDAISKTGKEVAAMLKATAGEYAAAAAKKFDKSDSNKTLDGISAVLAGAKTKALSTAGTLDIAGDINQIWATSDLAGAADIATLDGAKLYAQVHEQCKEMAAPSCSRPATLNMVVSAYGMYIVQDCNTIAARLESNRLAAQASVRQADRAMGAARLQTYTAHNSAEINACIAQVRIDITHPSACGPEFVHCLDATGLYLDYTTGAPLYTTNFFKLENLISLDGNVLLNNQNNLFINLLEKKKESAKRGLDTCRDIAASVWDEFKRQALVEIYQGQQKRIRQVKDECVAVLNKCYDEQLKNLKDFSNQAEFFLLGQRVELSEELCRIKLDTCSNLYGGGAQGLAELQSMMHNIGTSRISDNCKVSLTDFAKQLCSPSASDIGHSWPFDCRMYSPGQLTYMQNTPIKP